MTTPVVDALPIAPSADRPSTFDAEMFALLQALEDFPDQVNALVTFLASAAMPGGIVIPYTFDGSSASVADPGNGKLRLDNLTQGSATAALADNLDNLAVSATGRLALLTSTSTIKGYVFVYAVGDPTKWLLASATASTAASGYYNITLSGTQVSGANPFTDGDALVMILVPKGDKGDGAVWSTFNTPTLTGSSITFQSLIPANSNDLKFDFDAVTNTSGLSAPTISLSANGSSFSTAVKLTTGAVIRATGSVNIRRHRANIVVVESALVDASLTSPAGQTASPIFIPHKISGGAIAVRFA